jgi:hypothetical protein
MVHSSRTGQHVYSLPREVGMTYRDIFEQLRKQMGPGASNKSLAVQVNYR